MTSETHQPTPAACCGERRPGEIRPVEPGQPLILACQLCPNSATYWRKEQP